MKKNILYIAAILSGAALLLVGCNKPSQEKASEIDSSRQMGVLTVNIGHGAPVTKATTTDTAGEGKMSTLDILVFHSGGTLDGKLETSERYTPNADTYSSEITVSLGAKTVVVLANVETSVISGITTLAQYQAIKWNFADNQRDRFVMWAQGNVTVSGNATSDKLDASLKRVVSRVQLLKVVNNLPTALGSFTLRGAYLINVARTQGNTTYADAQYWRPSTTGIATATKAMLEGPASTTLAKDAEWNAPAAGYYLYGFPNSAPAATNPDTKDYVTKLIIEGSILGTTYYYPIGISSMGENLAYKVNSVTIKRTGSTDPDKYVSKAALDVNIDVLDWTNGEIVGSYNGDVTGTADGGYTFSF